MPQNRGSGPRTRRFGAAVVVAALAAVATPATGQAQDAAGSLPDGTGNGSIDNAIGLLPEEIVIGGPGFGGGSDALRETGSGIIPDAALSVGQVIGSVAPLESLGVSGGSAAASVASSGSLPGSVYANPVGSIGSGTIGIGSLAVSEYAIGLLAFQAVGAYITVLAARQEAGTLTLDELTFWNNVVVGSAQGGRLLEDAAGAAGTELPGALAGSIDSVQRSALENPVETQDRIRAEAEAEAAAEAEDGDADAQAAGDTTGDATGDAAVENPGENTGENAGTPIDDDEVGTSPDTVGVQATPVGAGDGMPVLNAAAAPNPTAPNATAPNATVPNAEAPAAAPATLAATGSETATVAGLAVVSLLLGGFLLAASRRRA